MPLAHFHSSLQSDQITAGNARAICIIMSSQARDEPTFCLKFSVTSANVYGIYSPLLLRSLHPQFFPANRALESRDLRLILPLTWPQLR